MFPIHNSDWICTSVWLVYTVSVSSIMLAKLLVYNHLTHSLLASFTSPPHIQSFTLTHSHTPFLTHSLTHTLNLSPAIQFTLTVDSVFRRVGLYSSSGIGPFRMEDTFTITNGSNRSCAAPLEFALRVSHHSLCPLDYMLLG